ncbi:putative COX1/OXI3 intron 2 protein [Varanus komodoensis]|nr:putative COX1/OXI3 intron 2 protein [Varanus komodoensis]
MICWNHSWLQNWTRRAVTNDAFSNWGEVTSGVLQGSVLVPVLFNIFINDLDEKVQGMIIRFANDIKLGVIANTLEDRKKIQGDHDRLECWAENKRMKFSRDKHQVLHLGKRNQMHNIVILSKLNMSQQCDMAAKRANAINLGCVNRSITSKSCEVLVLLYSPLVRPHLEYCVLFWAPQFKKDADKLEGGQRMTTRVIQGLEKRPELERLKELAVLSLEKRKTMRRELSYTGGFLNAAGQPSERDG